MKNKGTFFSVLKSKNMLLIIILLLLPILFINCYSFYTTYSSLRLDYSVFEGISLQTILSGSEGIKKITDAYDNFFVFSSQNASAADMILSCICVILELFLITFTIIRSDEVCNNRKRKNIVRETFSKLIPIFVAGLFLSQIQQIVASVMLSMTFLLRAMGTQMLPASIAASAFYYALLFIFSVWVLLYVAFCAITAASGRTRFLLTFAYSREILKKNVIKTMLKTALWIAACVFVPAALEVTAIFNVHTMNTALLLAAAATLFEVLGICFMLIYLTPVYASLEEKSGIKDKIRQAYENAIKKMQQDKENEQNNNNNSNTEE